MIHYDTTTIDAINGGYDMPMRIRDPLEPGRLIGTLKYVSTDGWRGYYSLKPTARYKRVGEDWVTGDWDDAIAAEHGETPTEAKFKALEQQYGDIYVVYSPTSNVFSTAYDVLVKVQVAPHAARALVKSR